jgi:hypothetical protein
MVNKRFWHPRRPGMETPRENRFRRGVLPQFIDDQLAARRLTLPSASEVSFWSVIFSSSSVFCRMLAQSLRPSCRAHAIRLP